METKKEKAIVEKYWTYLTDRDKELFVNQNN